MADKILQLPQRSLKQFREELRKTQQSPPTKSRSAFVKPPVRFLRAMPKMSSKRQAEEDVTPKVAKKQKVIDFARVTALADKKKENIPWDSTSSLKTRQEARHDLSDRAELQKYKDWCQNFATSWAWAIENVNQYNQHYTTQCVDSGDKLYGGVRCPDSYFEVSEIANLRHRCIG